MNDQRALTETYNRICQVEDITKGKLSIPSYLQSPSAQIAQYRWKKIHNVSTLLRETILDWLRNPNPPEDGQTSLIEEEDE
uniref:Uncharacterized protein n=1 Tax=viral metagenome TaxID=1070528 RepID=A0A6M3LGS9_9ZZZZ